MTELRHSNCQTERRRQLVARPAAETPVGILRRANRVDHLERGARETPSATCQTL